MKPRRHYHGMRRYYWAVPSKLRTTVEVGAIVTALVVGLCVLAFASMWLCYGMMQLFGLPPGMGG